MSSPFLTQTLFISQLGSRLLKFQRKSSNLYNMRCIVCGDSQKNKNKARAYLFLRDGKFFYHCHNCNKSMNFETFIRTVDPGLYAEYNMALLEDKSLAQLPYLAKLAKPPKAIPIETVKGVVKISDLPRGHEARLYLEGRKLPREWINRMYWTETFKETTNTLIPNKFDADGPDEARILIPFFDQNKEFFGFQGRTLNPKSELRYITIIFNPNKPKLFGLDRVDFNRRYYVFEGPFDSMFIPNSIASAGGRIFSELKSINANLDNAVIVADNEPRNRDVCRGVKAAINLGLKVVIWPSNFVFKDVNEAILSSRTEAQILDIIERNTFSDLEADLHFEEWKKV